MRRDDVMAFYGDATSVRPRAFAATRLGHNLTDEESRQIIHNVKGFFGVLAEWSRAEKLIAPMIRARCTV